MKYHRFFFIFWVLKRRDETEKDVEEQKKRNFLSLFALMFSQV
jgi:hypothetical protein